jgi:hypothetical protein
MSREGEAGRGMTHDCASHRAQRIEVAVVGDEAVARERQIGELILPDRFVTGSRAAGLTN